MTWKTLAKRTNSLPEGWSSPDEIAAELDCEISEVDKILAAAKSAGLVEKRAFPHWQEGSRALLYVTGYRQSKPGESKPQPTPSAPDELTAAVHRIVAKHPGLPAHRIVAYLPPRIRGGIKVAQVNAILSR